MTAMRPKHTDGLRSEIAQRASFDKIRYAQGWEDPESLRGALSPNASSTILSIAAAGDNSFALLLQGAGSVVSIDLSPAQCALVELKRTAIRTLDYDEFVRFIGARPAGDRQHSYAHIRRELPLDVRAFWDEQPALISAGVIHVGKLERMWHTFRTRVLPLLHSRTTIRAVFEPRTRHERELFWHERWSNRRWQYALRLFFSQPVIARLGRDPSFFEHVTIDVGRHYAARAWHAFVELDPSTNPYLQYILLGRFLDTSSGGPSWLARENYDLLRLRLDDLEIVHAELETYLHTCDPGTFTGFNLSDVFEWMSDDLHEQVYRSIIRTATPDAVLAYWNNLVPRSAPSSLLDAGVVVADPELAQRLHAADRAFLYRGFHVDRIIDPEAAQ